MTRASAMPWPRMTDLTAGVPVVMAVNREYAGSDASAAGRR